MDCQLELSGEWEQKCLKSAHAFLHTITHTYTKTKTPKHSTVPLFAFMQVDTLVSLLQALTAFHYWKKKVSPWQQLLPFVGCNMCNDIIQQHGSEVPADAHFLTCQSKSHAPSDKKGKKNIKCIVKIDISTLKQ